MISAQLATKKHTSQFIDTKWSKEPGLPSFTRPQVPNDLLNLSLDDNLLLQWHFYPTCKTQDTSSQAKRMVSGFVQRSAYCYERAQCLSPGGRVYIVGCQCFHLACMPVFTEYIYQIRNSLYLLGSGSDVLFLASELPNISFRARQVNHRSGSSALNPMKILSAS